MHASNDRTELMPVTWTHPAHMKLGWTILLGPLAGLSLYLWHA